MLIDLKCKEVHEKELVLDRKKLEDKIRQRLKTRLELEEQLKDIEMRRLERKEEEEQFRTEQLKLLADEDRLEMLTKEKQRIKKQEHHRIVREMLTAREHARNAEIFDVVKEHNELIALEKRRFVICIYSIVSQSHYNFHFQQTRDLCHGTNENLATAC